MDDVFAKYNTAKSLHRELMNILLLCTHESNYYYCYCHKEKQPNVHFVNFVSIFPMLKLKICQLKIF